MASGKEIRTTYSLHGLRLQLMTNSRFIRDSIHLLLGCFPAQGTASGPPDIGIRLFGCPTLSDIPLSVPENSKLLYRSRAGDRFDVRDFGIDGLALQLAPNGLDFYLKVDGWGLLAYRPETGEADGYLRQPESLSPVVLSSFIFMIVLSQLLAARKCYPLHCAGVEREGKGILIPGFSGAGKTTACVSLIRGGYGFLGDDRPLLRQGPDGDLRLLAFPEPIDVTPGTVALFPELRRAGLLKGGQNLRKESFSAEDVYPGVTRESCVPEAIVFPEIAEIPESRLEELPRIEALKRFLPHSLVVLDRQTAEAHFGILADLIEQCHCYRLHFGRDVSALPELVASIL